MYLLYRTIYFDLYFLNGYKVLVVQLPSVQVAAGLCPRSSAVQPTSSSAVASQSG